MEANLRHRQYTRRAPVGHDATVKTPPTSSSHMFLFTRSCFSPLEDFCKCASESYFRRGARTHAYVLEKDQRSSVKVYQKRRFASCRICRHHACATAYGPGRHEEVFGVRCSPPDTQPTITISPYTSTKVKPARAASYTTLSQFYCGVFLAPLATSEEFGGS